MSERDIEAKEIKEEVKETIDEAGEKACEEAEKSLEESLQDELLEQKDKYVRLFAEFENYKKTMQRERVDQIKFATQGLILGLLPILDNLEHAVIAAKNEESSGSSSVLIGVEMVLKQFIEELKKFGVEVFSAKGKTFDPSCHEAMGEKESDDIEAGIVMEEYQKGYSLHGRLLRPARVVIAKKKSELES